MKIKIIVTLIASLAMLGSLHAQNLIKGKVIDAELQEPIPGVSILVKGGKAGTVSDRDGNFSLHTDEEDRNLEFSFVGFQTRLVSIANFPSSGQVILNPTSVDLAEVTVVGFEQNRSLLESTGAIAIAGPRDFDRADKTDLAQMLNHIPGVQVRGANVLRPSTISIRGQGARGPGQTGRIKIYLNDLMLTNADGTNAWEDIDPFSIGTVEVIKGPGSSIYGASVGGVLNIKTQSAPYGEHSVEGFSLLGSFNSLRYGSTYRLSDDKVNIMAAVGTQSTDGFREHSQEQRDFATFLGTFTNGDNNTTTFFFNRNKYDSRAAGTLTREQVEEDPRQALPVSVLQNTGRIATFTRMGISNEWEINNKWKNISSLTMSFSDLDHPINFLYIYQWNQNVGGRTRFIHETNLLDIKAFLTLGGEYLTGVVKTNFYGIEEGRPTAAVTGDREAVVNNGIIFGQAEIEMSEKLLLTGGMSVNFYEFGNLELTLPGAERQLRSFDPFVAPRLAFNYRPQKNIAIHGNISAGFTPPAIGDINRPDGTVNLDLREETAINFEIGSRGKALKGWLEYDVNIYRMNLTDEILTRTPEIGFAIRENAGETSYTGVEAYFKSDLIKNPNRFIATIMPTLGVTLQETVFVDFRESIAQGGEVVETDLAGNRVPGNAPSRIFSNLEVGARNGLYLFANLEWVDRLPIDNANTVFNDAFTFVSSKAGWRGYLNAKFEANVFVGVNNLLDQLYSDSPALNPNPIASGPLAGQIPYLNLNWGRNYYAGLHLKYHL
ncbi:TonB-dependent receptor domain-containing protein [Pleomorphovibrio marinus]|uniref:TonB-dependent receptor domain-containing protein n=1 Tax=Pleomorphovibrio marinus TaxID=2164132 RepID=UPI000E0CB28B|nr:TonB-dependent receptor [Pleomorphovibrio marinus]